MKKSLASVGHGHGLPGFGKMSGPRMFLDKPDENGAQGGAGTATKTRAGAEAGKRGRLGEAAMEFASSQHASDGERDTIATLIETMAATTRAHQELIERVERGDFGDGGVKVKKAGERVDLDGDAPFDPSQLETIKSVDQARGAIVRLYNELADLKNERDQQQKSIAQRFGVEGLSDDGSELKDTDGKFKKNAMGLGPIAQCIVGSFHGFAGGDSVWPVLPMLKAFHTKSGLPLDTGATGQLGALIPPQFMDEMIERLRARTVALMLGARFMDLDGAPARWNRNQMNTQAHWVGEGVEVEKSDAALGMLQLMPKELAAATDIQKRLLRLTNGAAQETVEDDIDRAIAEALDLGIIRGTGGNAQPMGIMNTPGIGQTDFSTAFGGIEYGSSSDSQNVTKLLDLMVAKVDARNAYSAQGSNAFAAHPLAVNQLRTAQDRNGNHILHPFGDRAQQSQASAVGTPRGELWGHPLGTTSNLLYGTGGTDLLFGDWSQILVGNWGPMLVESSNEHDKNFMKGLVTIRAEMLVDAGVRHVEAFEMATSWTDVDAITL